MKPRDGMRKGRTKKCYGKIEMGRCKRGGDTEVKTNPKRDERINTALVSAC